MTDRRLVPTTTTASQAAIARTWRARKPPSTQPSTAAGTEADSAWPATARLTCRGFAPIQRSIASSRCCCATAVPIVETTTKIDM
jgi:hypothetical protein